MHREFILKLLIQIHTCGFVLGLINLISVFPFSMSKILALKNTSIISHLLWSRIHTRVSNLQSVPCERSQAQKRECHHQPTNVTKAGTVLCCWARGPDCDAQYHCDRWWLNIEDCDWYCGRFLFLTVLSFCFEQIPLEIYRILKPLE